jgi:hypothetical protein
LICLHRVQFQSRSTCRFLGQFGLWYFYAIVGAFGMISKLQLEPANRPIDPNGISMFYLLVCFG